MAEINVKLKQKGRTSSLLSLNDHQIVIDRPVDKGGNGEGPMGGQVLLMSIAGCFSSTLYAAAQARNLQIENLEMDVIGVLSENAPKRFESIKLEITAGSCGDKKEFTKLLKVAEKGCIAVNTIKSGMGFQATQTNNI